MVGATIPSLYLLFIYLFIFLLVFFCLVIVFFRLHQNAFFKYTYFNRLLAVRVQVIIQLAKTFWSRKDEIFHSVWF